MKRSNVRGRFRNRLVMFVKEPQAGKVKTRLAADIGTVPAAWWYRHNMRRTIRRLARDPRWELILAVTPDARGLTSRVWPRAVRRIPQGGGDLGVRIERVMRGGDQGAVLIIGSDIPDIMPADIARGFRELATGQFVIGPSPDGGYWAIGCTPRVRGWPPGTLMGIRWSSCHAQADTIAALACLCLPSFLQGRGDVDTAEDMAVSHLAPRDGSPSPFRNAPT